MSLLLGGMVLFFLGGVLALFGGQKQSGRLFIASAVIAQFLVLPPAFQVLTRGSLLSLAIDFSFPIGRAMLRLDPLAAFFVAVISLGGLFAAVYSLGYMKMYRDSSYSLPMYYFFLGLLFSAMLLVTIVQNVLLFMIVWEMMSLASYFLVAFEHHKEEVNRAALYYLIAMQVGAAFLLIAFVWAASLAGSMDFAALGSALGTPGSASSVLFLLFLIGFGFKAGLVPVHTWLPLAHPAAPTGVSAAMSGVMIKTGIYGILRILLIGGTPHIALCYLLFILSLITGIYGVMNAIVQQDLKKLLAYSSIENIGIIGVGIGLAMLGIAYRQEAIVLWALSGALVHIVSHSTIKGLLFYGAGVVYSTVHTREIDKLGGLIHFLPVTATSFLIGSLAISGLPVFGGFIGEFSIFAGLVQGLRPGATSLHIAAACGLAGLAFIGVMAALCFNRVFSIVFLGIPRVPHREKPSEASVAMKAPMIFLAAFIIFIGLLPVLILPLLKNVIGQFIPGLNGAEWEGMMALFNRMSLALAVFGGLVCFFLVLRRIALSGKRVQIFKTWDCGSQEESSRFSYTAGSFAAPFFQLVEPFLPRHLKVHAPDGFFPREAGYESRYEDLAAVYLIDPVNRFIRWFMGLFAWVQSGRTQQYILYGLVFLLLLIVWIIGMS